MSETKTRSANIELLRVVAMFMIVIYHIVCHCVRIQITNPGSMWRSATDYFERPVFIPQVLILNCIMTFGIVGNCIFILISGYFMAVRSTDSIKIGSISKKLMLQMGFAAVVLVCAPPLLHLIRPHAYIALQSINIFNQMSWFVGYYFVVILCGVLFLNRFLQSLDRSRYLAFLLAVFAFFSLSFSGKLAESLMGGLRTVLCGVFLYSLGGFIHKYDPFRKVRLYIFFAVIAAVYGLICLSAYNDTCRKIAEYLKKNSDGAFKQTINSFDNFSIVIIIIAVCMFELFRRIHLPSDRFITFLGSATFMVYLIHDNKFFYYIWNIQDWAALLQKSTVGFILMLIVWALLTFITGVLAYIVYIGVMALLKKERRFAVRSDE